MIFLDTSAAFAFVNREDDRHRASVKTFEAILDRGETLFTHNYAILETVALLQRRIGLAAAIAFQRDTQSYVEIHWVTESDHEQAVESWLERDTRRLSLVDCMSFVVMRVYGCKTAFAYDSDFETEGFELIG